MVDPKQLNDLRKARAEWEQKTLASTLKRAPERQSKFITTSSDEVARLYDPTDLPDFDYLDDLGLPGEYPYTRGVHATRLSGQTLDHAHVRRVRIRRGIERPLQVPARARAGPASRSPSTCPP